MSLLIIFFVACNGWMEYFLCCILIVTSEKTGKKIWIHHYICNFIVIVQRKQPLQCLTAVQAVLFLTRDEIMSLWSALGCPQSHMRETSLGLTWLSQAGLTPATCTSSCPPNTEKGMHSMGRVNRNSSMDQEHESKNKNLLCHINSHRPGFPHQVWCC